MGPGIICLLCLRDEPVLICFRMTQWWGEREGRRFVGQNREENITFQRRTLAMATFHGTRCPEKPQMFSLPNEPIFLYRHPKLLEPVAISNHHYAASLALLPGCPSNLLTAVCPMACSQGENALVKLEWMVSLLDGQLLPPKGGVCFLFHPLNLGWPCDLLQPIECGGSDHIWVLRLSLKIPHSFCSWSSGTLRLRHVEGQASLLDDERQMSQPPQPCQMTARYTPEAEPPCSCAAGYKYVREYKQDQ